MARLTKHLKTAIVAGVATMVVSAAVAQDFFSFFGFGRPPAARERSYAPMPFADDDGGYEYTPRVNRASRPPQVRTGGGQAFCVRTCDGRYFPINASDRSGRTESCNNFCPASETKVFYGSAIDHASTENGKSYADLPNAFRFRNELVAGCTCNGKDQIGLAPIKIEDDPTLKKGDIVAGKDGLMVSRPSDRRGASLELAPASRSVRDRYERAPVFASDDR